MRILTASDRALLVETADLDEAMRLNHALRGIPGVAGTVPGARTVLVHFDPALLPAVRLRAVIAELPLPPLPTPDGEEVCVPVHYDGEDLEETATLLGVSVEELIARHTAATWRVAFAGFAPGFGYLIGDDALFEVPRRATPRVRVPAGSVGLAGPFSGVYPRESPGGWQLIGRTDAVMWDILRTPPALLGPGTVVRFVRADHGQSAGRSATPELRATVPAAAGGLEVISPGLQLLVQDRGRFGHAGIGVSGSGPADRIALHDANRAVGNPRDAAGLEGIGGAVLRVHSAGVLALTGAEAAAFVTETEGAVREVQHGAPFPVSPGEVLEWGAARRGLRTMLGVRGGITTVPVLGSVATDTLAGLGPEPLHAGDILSVAENARSAVMPYPLLRTLPAPGELVALTVTLGPRDDWFTAEALRALLEQEWLVTPRADRVGIRLQSAHALQRRVTGELPSEGVVTGAIQVPADGWPVLFLPDHPLTGGYPVIAAITDDGLDLAGQLPPGARVRFRVSGE